MKDKLILIADHYGLGTQLLKLAEECSEYSAASAKWNVYNRLLSKTGRNRFKEKRDAAAVDCMKELADVLVLARQVEYLMESDPEFKTEVEKLMDAKCDRQISRIEEELQSTQTDKLDLKDTIDFMLSGSVEERMIAESNNWRSERTNSVTSCGQSSKARLHPLILSFTKIYGSSSRL